MSFRNRCEIAGAEGIIALSVPLGGGRDQKRIMKDVKISDRMDWQSQHFKTIVSCYSRSPWFEYYRDDLSDLYKQPVTWLLDWNLRCFQWSLTALKMPLAFSLSDSYQKEFSAPGWVDGRGRFLPKNRDGKTGIFHGSGGGRMVGKNGGILGDPEGAEVDKVGGVDGTAGGTETAGNGDPFPGMNGGINEARPMVDFTGEPGDRIPDAGPDYDDRWGQLLPREPLKYRQVFEERIGFLPGLSILDLLFCEGSRAKELLV